MTDELTPIAYRLLVVLQPLGVVTGAEIGKAWRARKNAPRLFNNTLFSSLGRLGDRRLVKRTPRHGRAGLRWAYSITERGRQALAATTEEYQSLLRWSAEAG